MRKPYCWKSDETRAIRVAASRGPRRKSEATVRRLVQQQRARNLKRDLALLAWVVQVERNRLLFPEKNRQQALVAYHRNRLVINAKRRTPEKARLLRAIERVCKQLSVEKPQRCRSLERAYRANFSRIERKLRKRLCSRWVHSVKTQISSGFILSLSGVSIATLREHLSNQFKPGMTWNNHGYGAGKWNIDHIIPLAAFDLPAQAKQAFHYKNLQPLWHEENMLKRDSLESYTVPLYEIGITAK